PQKIEDILLSNAPVQLCLGKVALQDLGRLRVFLNKYTRRGTAAESFNVGGPAPSEKIENARADDHVAQAGKDGSLDAIHCRSHTALGNCQADPAGGAGDHPHGETTGVGVAVA